MVGLVTFVRRAERCPLMSASLSVVTSFSGSAVCAGSGVPWGHSGSVAVWAGAIRGAASDSIKRKADSKVGKIDRRVMRNMVRREMRFCGKRKTFLADPIFVPWTSLHPYREEIFFPLPCS